VLSDQLSDYEGEDGYTTAHVDIRSSRSARDFGRASGMLHTEEVTGSNPVSPTTNFPSQGDISKIIPYPLPDSYPMSTHFQVQEGSAAERDPELVGHLGDVGQVLPGPGVRRGIWS
jgi:hypothetical protein